jgi:hypothetical protein
MEDIKKMLDKKNNKFDQIDNIYSQFSEKNKENLVKTAKSLLKIQHENAVMLAEMETQRRPAPREDSLKR